MSSNRLPRCWGHRGASAAFPENTLKSFEAAIRDGAEGIESDVHVTSDNVIILFHDANLDRTTNGTGLIKDQAYHDNIDRLLTIKSPAQPVPTFEQTIDLLCRPENAHAQFNIDVKIDNDPDRLFGLMNTIISRQANYVDTLGPRLILGLWHPRFIDSAKFHLPYCKLSFIGRSIPIARQYFWRDCQAFSINYNSLIGRDGEMFRNECRESGKELYVWTVNKRNEMIRSAKWGVSVILTDRTADLVNLRQEMKDDWNKVSEEVPNDVTLWSSLNVFWFLNSIVAAWDLYQIDKRAKAYVSQTQSVRA